MTALPRLSLLHQRHTTIKHCGREGYNYVVADVEEEKEEEEEEDKEEEEQKEEEEEEEEIN